MLGYLCCDILVKQSIIYRLYVEDSQCLVNCSTSSNNCLINLLSLRAPDRLSQVVAGLILNVKSIAVDDGDEVLLSEVCWADCAVIG